MNDSCKNCGWGYHSLLCSIFFHLFNKCFYQHFLACIMYFFVRMNESDDRLRLLNVLQAFMIASYFYCMSGGGIGLSSSERRQSATPRASIRCPLSGSRKLPFFCRALADFFCPYNFFLSAVAISWMVLCSYIIFCLSTVAKSDGLMLLYNFCPSTVVKSGINLPIL